MTTQTPEARPATSHTAEARVSSLRSTWADFTIAWNDTSLSGVTWADLPIGLHSKEARPATSHTLEVRP